jgi:hypothetical protein
MSGDNILPFERRRSKSDPIDLAEALRKSWDDAPHKGMDLPGHPLGWPYDETVDLGQHGKFRVGEPIHYGESVPATVKREQDHMTDSLRYALDAASRQRAAKPSWSARYGFAVTVMAVVAVFAYIGACVARGPWPGDWQSGDWIFVGVCLLIGAGYIAAQERNNHGN